jgi:hypothetical protein
MTAILIFLVVDISMPFEGVHLIEKRFLQGCCGPLCLPTVMEIARVRYQ